jgi:uncharacterized protein (TIGR03435 family)
MRSLLAIMPVVLGLINAPPQSGAQSSAPAFEVASIKLNHTGGGNSSINVRPGGRFIADNVPLRGLLKEAYHVKDSQLLGAPSWIDSERYDIQAKMDDAAAAAMQTMNGDQRREQLAQMLQSLFVDRLKLTLHHETKELPVYALLVAKNGSKLKETAVPSSESGPPNPQGSPGPVPKGPMVRIGRGVLTATAVRLDMFAEMLSMQVGRVVLDKTGLKAYYDFELRWTPDESQGQMFKGAGIGPPTEAAPPPDATGPALFTALQEQLGLKLESQKSPLDVLVIEHIGRPSEN